MLTETAVKKPEGYSPETGSAPAPKKQTQAQGLNILLAFDGSPHAQAAIDLVSDLFKPCVRNQSCALTAITVMPTQYIGGHEELQIALSQLQRRLEQNGLDVTTILKAGNPAASLNAYAEEIKANLIVIGARGRRSALGILLGGVAQQVIEYSTCPVLVVRAPYRKIRHVLVLSDGSVYSQRMIEYLIPQCPQHPLETATPEQSHRLRCPWLPAETQITVMHVLAPPLSPEVASRAWALGPEALYPAPMAPIDVTAINEEERQHGEQVLAEAKAAFAAASFAVQTVMPQGDAAEEIMRYTSENSVDLIACGSRGLGAVTGWLLGSVSRKLVHYADCSILIVK